MADGAVSTDVSSTSSAAPTAAFEKWRALISDTFVPLTASPTSPRPFHGRVTHSTYDGFEMSTVRAGGQRVRRTRQLIAASSEEYLLASIQTAGRGRVEQGGRVAVLEPGSLAFYESTHPYTLHFDDEFEQVVVQVPLDTALRSTGIRRSDAVTAVALGHEGAAGVVGGFFRALSVAQQQDPAGAGVLAAHGPGLLTAALGLAAHAAPGPGAVTALRREQVLAHLRAHLADPMLDADAVAAACHLSRRSLYRLFDDAGDSLGDHLRRLRVEHGQQLLRQEPERPVAGVGAACGFAGEAQFHRAFHRVTGTTPAAYRAAGGTERQPAGTRGQSATG